mgnify:CR=1 FL=1
MNRGEDDIVEGSTAYTESPSGSDSDGDGISNLGEYTYDSNPNSNDTDGDCILDADEILWAATQANVSAGDALTQADADGDGVPDEELPEPATEDGGVLPGFTAITGLASVLGAAILVAGRRKD